MKRSATDRREVVAGTRDSLGVTRPGHNRAGIVSWFPALALRTISRFQFITCPRKMTLGWWRFCVRARWVIDVSVGPLRRLWAERGGATASGGFSHSGAPGGCFASGNCVPQRCLSDALVG